MKKSYNIFAAMCAMLVALTASTLHDSAPDGDKDTQAPGNLRLLYWNIQNGMWSGQPDGYREFLEFVREKNPDICVWAEAQSNYRTASSEKYTDDSERYFPDAWGEFARKYGHNYCYKGGHRDRFPQVITSRYPIECVERIVGASPDSVVSHGAGWARIKVNGHVVNVVTLHTWPQRYAFGIDESARGADAAAHGGDRYRAKEIEYICRHTIESVPGADKQLWMMMGDFNAKSRLDNKHYRWPADTLAFLCHDYVLEHTPYIDVIAKKYPDSLVSSVSGNSRIDMVYCTPPLYDRITHAEIIRDGYTTPRRDERFRNFCHPSDHCPVLVDFDFSN